MTFYTTPTLETERLILRPLVLEDAAYTQPLFNNYEVMKYLHGKSIPQPYPDNGTKEYYQSYLLPEMDAGRTLAWTIIEKLTSNTMGVLQLSPEDQEDSRGFWLGTKYHRRGYITEAIIATTDYGFDVLNMPEMFLNNAAENIASRRVKEKAGADLINIADGHFVCGIKPKEFWRLTPERWAMSPMKRAAKSPSYKVATE